MNTYNWSKEVAYEQAIAAFLENGSPEDPMLTSSLGVAAAEEGWRLVRLGNRTGGNRVTEDKGRAFYLAPDRVTYYHRKDEAKEAAEQLRQGNPLPTPGPAVLVSPEKKKMSTKKKGPFDKHGPKWLIHRALCNGHTTLETIHHFCNSRRPAEMAKGRNPARDRKVLVEEAVNGIWWERVPTDAQGGCAAASGGPEVSPSSSNAGGAAAEQEIPEVMDVEEEEDRAATPQRRAEAMEVVALLRSRTG